MLSSAIAPQVKTFKPGDDVATGIKSVSIPGHTPGHVGYMISSQGQTLLDVGDTIHSSIVSLQDQAGRWDMIVISQLEKRADETCSSSLLWITNSFSRAFSLPRGGLDRLNGRSFRMGSEKLKAHAFGGSQRTTVSARTSGFFCPRSHRRSQSMFGAATAAVRDSTGFSHSRMVRPNEAFFCGQRDLL